MNAEMPPTPESLKYLSNKRLVDELIAAASKGNEYDNRPMIAALRTALLVRLYRRVK
jgi:hypothetical protein